MRAGYERLGHLDRGGFKLERHMDEQTEGTEVNVNVEGDQPQPAESGQESGGEQGGGESGSQGGDSGDEASGS